MIFICVILTWILVQMSGPWWTYVLLWVGFTFHFFANYGKSQNNKGGDGQTR